MNPIDLQLIKIKDTVMSHCLNTLRTVMLAMALLFSVASVSANTSDIRLRTLSNEPISLNKIIDNGKYTLVMVWATNCPLCEEQKPMIQAFHVDYKDTKANVVGIAIDGIGKIDEINTIIDKSKPTYTNYVAAASTFLDDFEFATGKRFNATPTYIMFDPKGNALAVAIGVVTREQLDGAISQ